MGTHWCGKRPEKTNFWLTQRNEYGSLDIEMIITDKQIFVHKIVRNNCAECERRLIITNSRFDEPTLACPNGGGGNNR
jgi:hypothetical protein